MAVGWGPLAAGALPIVQSGYAMKVDRDCVQNVNVPIGDSWSRRAIDVNFMFV